MNPVLPGSVVLILGAGVSKPYGFPVGQQLREQILNTSATSFIKNLHLPGFFSVSHVERFLHEFQRAPLSSIDSFLEHRPEYSDLGKALIAFTLMPLESEDRLYGIGNNHDNSEGIYKYLWESILAPKKPEDVGARRTVIITYNYDRSLEVFLLNAFKSQFGLSERDALLLFGRIPILHVHGSFGSLDSANSEFRPYEGDLNGISEAHKRLQIVSEDIAHKATLGWCHGNIGTATAVVFLGFGYQETNVSRLLIPQILKDHHDLGDPLPLLMGTLLDRTPGERAAQIDPLFSGLAVSMEFHEMTALQLLREKGYQIWTHRPDKPTTR